MSGFFQRARQSVEGAVGAVGLAKTKQATGVDILKHGGQIVQAEADQAGAIEHRGERHTLWLMV